MGERKSQFLSVADLQSGVGKVAPFKEIKPKKTPMESGKDRRVQDYFFVICETLRCKEVNFAC